MSPRPRSGPLAPVLRHVEEELAASLTRICDRGDADPTTGEIERLSDTLGEASRQARAAAQLRRHMRANDVHARLADRLGTPPHPHPRFLSEERRERPESDEG